MIPVPRTDVEELKDIFREHGDSSSLAMRDVSANTELKQVTIVYRYIVRTLSFARKPVTAERN